MAIVDIFVLICVLAGLFSAAGVAFLPNILHAAIALIFSLLSVAGVYGALGADFMAAIQLIIYVGATIIVILFAIMMTPDIYEKRFIEIVPKLFVPTLLGSSFLAALWYVINKTSFTLMTATPAREPITTNMGRALIGPYALVFVYVSIVLLFGLVGAVVVARSSKEEQK